MKMRSKIIIAAITLAVIGGISFACYKIINKAKAVYNLVTDSVNIAASKAEEMPVQKQTGTEEYILNGKGYYKVLKYAPDIKSDEELLIEYNEFLNDMIQVAAQDAQKYEQFLPEEHKSFSEEKLEDSEKKIKEKSETLFEQASAEFKDNLMSFENAAAAVKNFMPGDKDKAAALYYFNLSLAEKTSSGYSEAKFEAYNTQMNYYAAKYAKTLFYTTFGLYSKMLDTAKSFTDLSLVEIYDPESEVKFREWRKRIIVSGVKNTIKLERSGYLVADIINKDLQKMETPQEDIIKKDIILHAQTLAEYNEDAPPFPEMEYFEYYSTKGEISKTTGFELFYFEFDSPFPLWTQELKNRNLHYLQNIIKQIFKQREDVKSSFTKKDDESTDKNIKENISFNGTAPEKRHWAASGTAVTKDNKVWVYLKRDNTAIYGEESLQSGESKALYKWMKSNDPKIQINIDSFSLHNSEQ